MPYENRTVIVVSVGERTTKATSVEPKVKYVIPLSAFPLPPQFGEVYEFRIDDSRPSYEFQRKLDVNAEIGSLYAELGAEDRYFGNPRFRRLRELQRLEVERMDSEFKKFIGQGDTKRSRRNSKRIERILLKYDTGGNI